MVKNALFLFVFLVLNAAAYGVDEKWVDAERSIAYKKLLLNISPKGASPGAVAASPSRENPNYFFHWIRDAALVMDVIARLYLTSDHLENKGFYRSLLLDFAEFSRRNQVTQTLAGIGEPKFGMNGDAVNDWWGRPQNDGPALRASVLIHLAWGLLQEGRKEEVYRLYDGKLPTYSVIKADLEYVSHHWREVCFDLWEELKGRHFYTLMVQRKALLEGALLAHYLGDRGASEWYGKQAKEISQEIGNFWNPQKKLIVPTLDRKEGVEYKNMDLDSAIVLGVLHGYTSDQFMKPSDDKVLATVFRLEEEFRKTYTINQIPSSLGMAIGRYPEDQYFGGNPWVLTTFAFAELYYRMVFEYASAQEIFVTPLNVNFFRRFFHGKNVLKSRMRITSAHPLFKILLEKLKNHGDTFLSRVQFHSLPDGSLSEQINRESGEMLSAENLTWNYAAFLTTVWARDVASLSY